MQQPDPAQFESQQVPRKADRVVRSFTAALCRDGQPDAEVLVEDFSPHGFKMRAVDELKPLAFFYLKVGADVRVPAQARWRDPAFIGCEFPRGLTSRQYLQIMSRVGAEASTPEPQGLFGRLRSRLFG